MSKYARYAPMMEKAVPKHRNLMNKLYNSLFGSRRIFPLLDDLSVLSYDEMATLVSVFSEVFIVDRLLNSRWPLIATKPIYHSSYTATEKCLHHYNCYLGLYKSFTVRFDAGLAIDDLCVLKCIIFDFERMQLFFDDDVKMVEAKLRLCEYLEEDIVS